MKLYSVLAAIGIALTLPAASVLAQEAAWQNSYKLETAAKYFDAIVALDPIPAAGPDAEMKLLRRGWLYYLAANYNESIREYRLAIDRNSRSIDARVGVTLPLLAQKRWREAELGAKAALDLSPNNYTGLLRLIIAQEAQQDWQFMLRNAEILVASYPTDATAYVYLARAHAWLGKRPEAVAAYNAVLARAPGNLEAKAYIEKK